MNPISSDVNESGTLELKGDNVMKLRFCSSNRKLKGAPRLLMAGLCAIVFIARPATAQDDVVPLEDAKIDVLYAEPAGPDPMLAQPVFEDDVSDVGDKDDDTSRPINGEIATFIGTGGFGLQVTLTGPITKSHIGYVVNSNSSSYQNMIILDDLTAIRNGMGTIRAACADITRSFPPSGRVMSSLPWTDDSSSSWAYWARRTAVHGVQNGYSQDEIQQNIWYITDRMGTYSNMRLLAAVGYSRTGPSKNAMSGGGSGGSGGSNGGSGGSGGSNGGGGGRPSVDLRSLISLCGAGLPFLFPLSAGCLICASLIRRRYRRVGSTERTTRNSADDRQASTQNEESQCAQNPVRETAARCSVKGSAILALMLLCSPALTGCATVLHGTTQKIPVNTNPNGALVLVDNAHEFTTPCTIPLERNRDHRVRIEMSGYETMEFQITRQPTGKAVNNIWIGGLIGLGVDAVTGADNMLVPDSIYVTLRPTANMLDTASTLQHDKFAAGNAQRH